MIYTVSLTVEVMGDSPAIAARKAILAITLGQGEPVPDIDIDVFRPDQIGLDLEARYSLRHLQKG